MEPQFIGILGVVGLLFLLAVGVDVAVALGAVSLVGLVILANLDAALSLISHSFYVVTSKYSFTVLPLFILMGNFASASGVTEKAYDFATKWLSQLRGGLYLVTTGASALFAAATGSSGATTVAIGKTVLPEMKKYGYDRRLSVACVAASGTLGVLIPPSVVMVMYGIVTEESIGRLLIAGLIPGIVSAVIYMGGIYLLVRLKPNLAPPAASYSWKERFQSIPGLWGVVFLFGLIIGGIYTGIFTPTEAGAIGAFAAIGLLAAKTKGDFFTKAKAAAWDTAMTIAMMFFIIMTAIVFTRFLTLAGVIEGLMSFVLNKNLSPVVILMFFFLASILLGMFLSASAALLLVAPIAHEVLTPLGYDGIWLGIVMVKMFELAVITPPIGLNVYIAKSLVPDLELVDVFRGIGIFALMDLITVAILVVFPQIALWLPSVAFD